MPEIASLSATEPVKVPATVAAVESRDFGAFREASQAQRSGKPLPEVERPAETVDGSSTDAGRALNANQRRREREQKRINDGIRAGVEAATKEKNAEIEALKKATPAPVTAAAVVVPAVEKVVEQPASEKVPEYKRFAAMPDAPKIQDFDNLDEHSAAMALFISDKRDEERTAKASHEDRVKKVLEKVDTYRERVAPKGDLSFLNSLHANIRDKDFKPIEALGEGEKATPINLLASQVVESEHAKPLLQHLSDHPELFHKFAQLQTPEAVFIEFGKLVASIDSPKEAATPRPKLVSDASKPVTQFAARNAAPSDPVMQAVKDRDFRAFRAARLARDAAKKAS